MQNVTPIGQAAPPTETINDKLVKIRVGLADLHDRQKNMANRCGLQPLPASVAQVSTPMSSLMDSVVNDIQRILADCHTEQSTLDRVA